MDGDFSDFAKLAADLEAAGENVARYADKAVRVTAHRIKDDWREAAARNGLGPYAADIDYEVRYPGGAIVAEIGPTPNGDQGSLGIVEDAPGKVRSAPQHAGRDALEANEDDFIRGLEIAVAESLGVVWE